MHESESRPVRDRHAAVGDALHAGLEAHAVVDRRDDGLGHAGALADLDSEIRDERELARDLDGALLPGRHVMRGAARASRRALERDLDGERVRLRCARDGVASGADCGWIIARP